jgi:hypothetical protein
MAIQMELQRLLGVVPIPVASEVGALDICVIEVVNE